MKTDLLIIGNTKIILPIEKYKTIESITLGKDEIEVNILNIKNDTVVITITPENYKEYEYIADNCVERNVKLFINNKYVECSNYIIYETI